MCCNTVPQTDNSEERKLIIVMTFTMTVMIPERMKLTEEGGKPQTVTQLSRGLGLGEAATSWALL